MKWAVTQKGLQAPKKMHFKVESAGSYPSYRTYALFTSRKHCELHLAKLAVLSKRTKKHPINRKYPRFEHFTLQTQQNTKGLRV